MAVDADDHVVADVAVDVGDDRLDLVRQRAAVGVAQHDVAGALHDRRLEGAQGELRVALEAVEEVLHVDHHAAAVAGRGTRTESAIIASPSSSVVCSALSTW